MAAAGYPWRYERGEKMIKTKFFHVFLFIISLIIVGCAGPNPNIGERTTDMAWYSGRYEDAIKVVKPHADNGEPWAQLRMGIFYENGWGVEKDIHKAIEWYEKVALQKAEGWWADGMMAGAIGKIGYFNQNSDARIAQLNLANLYFKGEGIEQNLQKAYLNAKTVVDETDGAGIFFCCEFAGGQSFPPEMISNLYKSILDKMTEEEIKKAEAIYNQMKANLSTHNKANSRAQRSPNRWESTEK